MLPAREKEREKRGKRSFHFLKVEETKRVRPKWRPVKQGEGPTYLSMGYALQTVTATT